MIERAIMTLSAEASPTDLAAVLDAVVANLVETLLANPQYRRIHDGRATRDEYLDFLQRTYHYVKHTHRQLSGGAEALAGHKDPAHAALRDELGHHASEEVGHEQWLLDDIRALGGDVEATVASEPCLAVKLYVASGEIVLASKNPLGILGVGYVLEGISEKFGSHMAKSLVERSGIPGIAAAVSFLASHGDADVGHMVEARATMRAIPSDADRAAIVMIAKLTATLYSHLLSP